MDRSTHHCAPINRCALVPLRVDRLSSVAADGSVRVTAASDRGGLRVAYLVNQYPKVSHSFIRREILALERQGVAVERFALRGWDDELPDAADRAERERTRYVLRTASAACSARRWRWR